MGVIRWLDRIDPERWKDACDRLVASPPATVAAAEAFLKAYGREASTLTIGGFEDAAAEPSLLPALVNGLLEEVVKEESWELDKCLSHGLERLPAFLPSLRPLRKIIDFEGLDVEAPECATATEGSGLLGCISPGKLEDCAAAVGAFSSIEDVTRALRGRKPGALSRLFGIGGPVRLAAELENDYFRLHWESLRTALAETSTRRHLLGLGMSA